MDYKTARTFLMTQATASGENANSFLERLQQGKPPVPGQVTNILLALKMVFEGLRGATSLDRELIYSLYVLSFESRQHFEEGRRIGIIWSPLLDEDLKRISRAVKGIFAGVWHSD